MTENPPTAYAEFVSWCQTQQRKYVMEQRAKMRHAVHAWRRYEETMRGMGLHPLDRREIEDRQRELECMMADIPISHGDSPSMRAAWETRDK